MSKIGKITNDQRNLILELIKTHVKQEKNCRVGWAVKEIIGEDVEYHLLDKLSSDLIESTRYTRDTANPNFEYDWNIRKNPNFYLSRINLIASVISVLAAIVSAYYAYKN